MRFRTALCFIPFVLLAACAATTGPIVPTGEPGQYTLTSRANGYGSSWVRLKSDALERAKSYCASQGLKLTKPDIASNHATGLMWPQAYITFNCDPIPQPKNTDQKPDQKQDAGQDGKTGQTPGR